MYFLKIRMGLGSFFTLSSIFSVKIQNKIQNLINIYSINDKVLNILLLRLLIRI